MFEKYKGINQKNLFNNPLTKEGIELWYKRVLAFYGKVGGVDMEIIEEMIPLNEITADYMYTKYTPLKIKYKKGSRPLLENVVSETIKQGMSEREKALKLMIRCRDNYLKGLAKPDIFYGGNEEELLKRGAIMCNEISRVFVCLCQIAGLPARLHGSHITGHMTAEVYANKKWRWIDPRFGVAPVLSNNQPVSAWELFKNPEIFDKQPLFVKKLYRPHGSLIIPGYEPSDNININLLSAFFKQAYFHPNEAMCLVNYFVWENEKYTYPWIIEPVDKIKLNQIRYNEQINKKRAKWPDFCFNPRLFEG